MSQVERMVAGGRFEPADLGGHLGQLGLAYRSHWLTIQNVIDSKDK
jgi:hypothetical protein